MIFKSEEDELEFYRILTTFEEEFGANNLYLYLNVNVLQSPEVLLFAHLEIRPCNSNMVQIKVKDLTANYTMFLETTEDIYE